MFVPVKLSTFLLLSGITASAESLLFTTDGGDEDEDEGVSPGDYGVDGNAPWYLRVQELAHDSLIAATRAQLAKDARASQDSRAAGVGNGEWRPVKIPALSVKLRFPAVRDEEPEGRRVLWRSS